VVAVILRCVEQSSSKSFPEGVTTVVVTPGVGWSSLSILEDGAEVATLSAGGGLAGIIGLLELAADSLDVDEWRLEGGPLAWHLLQTDGLTAICARLEIRLELSYGEFELAACEGGWPARLGLFPRWRRFRAWARGWLVGWSA
jgi:hypothetical protein